VEYSAEALMKVNAVQERVEAMEVQIAALKAKNVELEAKCQANTPVENGEKADPKS
jgi:hypothetical protein